MIYVHIPFCRSFCTYCDFYSEVASRCSADEQQKFGQFARALCREAALRADEIEDNNTLYIGGGTPSVLPLYVFSDLLKVLAEHGHGGPFREFTVEVNPEDIVQKGEEYVHGLLELGVNRISMGVQSFDDGILRWMNRRHDSATAREAYRILEDAGVQNISIDLIFGLSQLSDDQWNETLDKALAISSKGVLPQHISAYQLSVEPGSALAQLVDSGSGARHRRNSAQGSMISFVEGLEKPGIIIMRYLILPSLVMKRCTTVPTGAISHISVLVPALIALKIISGSGMRQIW